MIIAVEEGLENIKSKLSANGYKVVGLENCDMNVDAIVYKSIHLDTQIKTNLMNLANPNGILMIYANNKSFDEIDNILKTKVYSPLL